MLAVSNLNILSTQCFKLLPLSLIDKFLQNLLKKAVSYRYLLKTYNCYTILMSFHIKLFFGRSQNDAVHGVTRKALGAFYNYIPTLYPSDPPGKKRNISNHQDMSPHDEKWKSRARVCLADWKLESHRDIFQPWGLDGLGRPGSIISYRPNLRDPWGLKNIRITQGTSLCEVNWK